jgi:membrane protein
VLENAEPEMFARLRHILSALRSADFARYALRRFRDDRCLSAAASLSYTSLLALVPLGAISFAVLAAFPVFGGVREDIQKYIFANFLPAAGEAVQKYFDLYVANTGRLTAVGIVGLAVTSVLLLNTIENAMNLIFRVKQTRPLVPRLMMFWAVLTLGPLLLGASLSLSTYIYAMSEWAGADAFTGIGGAVTRGLPTVLAVAALVVFYVVIPNRPVRVRDALAGAVVAALLFLGLRKGFALYLAAGTTYHTLYGTLATVPIFLVWMYLTWSVVLLGGVLTASLGDWRGVAARRRALLHAEKEGEGARLELALVIISRLAETARRGGARPAETLVDSIDASEGAVHGLLEDLRAAGFVEANAEDGWVLARDLGVTTMLDLCRALGLVKDLTRYEPTTDDPWHDRLRDVVMATQAAERAVLDVPLREVLEAGSERAAGSGRAGVVSI